VSDALLHRAATDIDQPRPKNRPVNEGVAPERGGNAWVASHKFMQALVRDQANSRGNEGADAVVRDVQGETLEIGDVAGRMKRHDLPSSMREALGAANEAVENQTAGLGPLTVAYDGRIGVHYSHRDWKCKQRLLLRIREGSDTLQLPDEPVALWWKIIRHTQAALPCHSGGSAQVSQSSAPGSVADDVAILHS
jgi:hypothetical protein